MQLNLPLISIYNYMHDMYGTDIFSGLSVPVNTFDKDILVNTILHRGGEYEVIYSDADFLMSMINVWSGSHQNFMSRIWSALNQSYSPIENYNRTDGITDHNTGAGNSSSSGSNEHDVSAFDVNTYSHEFKDTSSSTTGNYYTQDNQRSVYSHGNIGVTTNQQMIDAEIKLYSAQNPYMIVAEAFLKEFVIPII